jgi:DNA-binding MarR family transcriptional regulator
MQLESKYLDFADELDRVRDTNDLPPSKWRALRAIAKCHLRGAPIRTVDLMHMADIASPATIHKMIKSLQDNQFIKIDSDKQDGRIKYLIPTAKTQKIFHDLASKM